MQLKSLLRRVGIPWVGNYGLRLLATCAGWKLPGEGSASVLDMLLMGPVPQSLEP